MKKKLSIFLSILLGITIFTGCSRTDIEYFNLNRDINSVSTGTFTGSILVSYDEKALIESFDHLFDPSAANSVNAAEATGISGERQKFTINYFAQIDTDDGYRLHLALDGDAGKQKIDLGDIYYDMEKGCYLSNQTMIGFFDLAKALNPDAADSYFYSSAFRNSLAQTLDDASYIVIAGSDEMAEMRTSMSEYTDFRELARNTQQALYDATVTFLINAFSDFTPSCIKKTANGYELNLTLEETIDIMIGAIDYMMDHNDAFYHALEDYINEMQNIPYFRSLFFSSDGSSDEKDFPPFTFASQDKKQANDTLNYLRAYLKSSQINGDFDHVKDTSYQVKLKKDGNAFQSKMQFVFLFDGQDVLNINTVSTLVPDKADMDFPEGGTSIELIENRIQELIETENPVTQLQFRWSKYNDSEEYGGDSINSDYDYGQLEIVCHDDTPLWLPSREKDDYIPYFVKSEQLYVPLSAVCNPLQMEYGWDEQNQQAYVMHSGEKISMDGLEDSGTFFVKVRDLQKLGYTIGYEKDDWEQIVTIEKNK